MSWYFLVDVHSVYNDVSQMLKKWCENDKKLYIYSSGSVEAQKLLFKNSESGDLETYLNGHFDTEIGPKTEASSYVSIAKAVGLDCNQILFLTDSIKGNNHNFSNVYWIEKSDSECVCVREREGKKQG